MIMSDKKIRVGVAGYGNLGRGVLLSLSQNSDMTPVAVFTRRDPASLRVEGDVNVLVLADAVNYASDIDVMIICGGSATDLPKLTPALVKNFNVVDSFDTHAKIPEHFAAVDAAARAGGHTGLISAGWDPGMFSINRLYSESILPCGDSYTFWGRGVSQGHSDAIRRIPGVKRGIQYTVPSENAMEKVRCGERPTLTTREKHTRECFVVADEGADRVAIEKSIVTMPNYFTEYDTTVHFISEEEFDRDHRAMPHGGFVMRSGESASGAKHLIEYSLRLDSNPEFTAGVLVAAARAVVRIAGEGRTGALTMFDVPPAYLSPLNGDALRHRML